MNASKDTPIIAIIGGGIIGTCIAIRLQEAGIATILIDNNKGEMRASEGNACAFAFSEVFPMASPRIMRDAPKWLVDPEGPLSIPPRYLAKITPWLVKFTRSSSKKNFDKNTKAQLALMELSQACLEPFMTGTSTRDLLHKNGVLKLYESRENFEKSKAMWQMAEGYGIPFTHLETLDALREYEPSLSEKIVAGTFTPQWWRIENPQIYLQRLKETYQKRGGVLRSGAAKALEYGEEGVVVHLQDDAPIMATKVVVASGAWSHLLARTLGEKIPLETERGYNTTFWQTEFQPRCHLSLSERGFVISPIGEGVRVGGAVELGGLDLPPNYRRADHMLKVAKSILPELEVEGGVQWMGFRPSLPDSLPAIGFSKSGTRVIYAFGHGHLGLTQSAGSADIVADLVLEQAPKIDISPFDPHRFGR